MEGFSNGLNMRWKDQLCTSRISTSEATRNRGWGSMHPKGEQLSAALVLEYANLAKFESVYA